MKKLLGFVLAAAFCAVLAATIVWGTTATPVVFMLGVFLVASIYRIHVVDSFELPQAIRTAETIYVVFVVFVLIELWMLGNLPP